MKKTKGRSWFFCPKKKVLIPFPSQTFCANLTQTFPVVLPSSSKSHLTLLLLAISYLYTIICNLELKSTSHTLQPPQSPLIDAPLIDKALILPFLNSPLSICCLPLRSLYTDHRRKLLHRHPLACQPQRRKCREWSGQRRPKGTRSVRCCRRGTKIPGREDRRTLQRAT